MTELKQSILMVMFFTVLTGFVFPALVWVGAQGLFPHEANGSFIPNGSGAIVGSELVGQRFSSEKYFHPRPSAAGNGYDPTASGGTNLGPISKKLVEGIDDDPATAEANESYDGFTDLAALYRKENGLPEGAILPADAVTRSSSGLDPHISPANALLQAGRVARARGLAEQKVSELVKDLTEGRSLIIWGEPRVNVLKLNLALDHAFPGGT